MTGFEYTSAHARVMCVCVRACVRARSHAQRSVGRSAFVGEKSLSFPHNQGAASHTSVRAYFYIHSRGTREVRIIRPAAGRKKKNARGMHTEERLYRVLFKSAPSSFLCSCPFPRKLICRCEPHPRKSELPPFKKSGNSFYAARKTNANSLRFVIFFQFYRQIIMSV